MEALRQVLQLSRNLNLASTKPFSDRGNTLVPKHEASQHSEGGSFLSPGLRLNAEWSRKGERKTSNIWAGSEAVFFTAPPGKKNKCENNHKAWIQELLCHLPLFCLQVCTHTLADGLVKSAKCEPTAQPTHFLLLAFCSLSKLLCRGVG